MSERPLDIVLVTKEQEVVQRIRLAFEADGHPKTLTVVSNMREAKRCLARRIPDLVIADLHLPDGHAGQLLPPPGNEHPYPLLILTREADEGHAADLRQAGALDYVVKSSITLAAMPRIARRVLRVWDQITRRRQLEALLRESERHVEELLDGVPVGYVELDAEGRITRVNRTELEMLGFTANEMMGHPVREFIAASAESKSETPDLPQGFPDAGQRIVGEARRKDGTILPVRIEGYPLRDAGGRITGLRSCMVDLTDRRRAEEAVEGERRRLYAALDAIPFLLYLQAPDHSIRFANRSFRDTLSDPKGRRCYEVLRGRTNPCDTCRGTCAAQAPAPPMWEWTASNGRTYLMHNAPLADADGSPLMLVVGFDVTDRKEAESERQDLEARIHHAQKMESLGLLAGGIAHDFNNLLVAILGNAGLALMDLPEDSPARDSIEQIETAAQRAAELTNQMLAYSGRGKFVVRSVNVSRLVEEMAHLIGSAISKKISLHLDMEGNLPIVEADVTQIRQVVMNLITNAADAIGAHRGTITIKTQVAQTDEEVLSHTLLGEELPEGPYVCLEISDTGCGMNAETRTRIFDPFFTTKATGRGLGLAAVLGIVRAHRGTIRVDSEPGKGSRFSVLLPCSTVPAVEANHIADLVAGWTPQGTILVIDDEPFVCHVAGQILKHYGVKVITATSGQEGLKAFRAHVDEIKAVLLDMTMPDMNGEEVFRELRRIRKDVSIILSSGYQEQEITQRFANGAPHGFVQKPYRAETLLEALKKSLKD